MTVTNASSNAPAILVMSAMLAGCVVSTPPVSDTEIVQFTGSITKSLEEKSRGFDGKLTPEIAVQRAISKNYSLAAKLYASSLAEAKARVESGGMLPEIIAESNYYRRNKLQLSRSSLSTNSSHSSNTTSLSQSIALSFSILDFGLSYIRTLQASDRIHQSIEEYRRIEARLIEQARSVYWKAVALKMLLAEMKPMNAKIDAALALSKKAVADPMLDPTEMINFQRNTLNTRREINDLFSAIAGAEHELKELVAVATDQTVTLNTRRSLKDIKLPATSSEVDVFVALQQRPEIRQHMYDLRLNEKEIYAAVLDVLPGIKLNQSYNTDSNPFLFHSNWVSSGADIASKLVSIARLPARMDAIEQQTELDRQSALATASAIIMQVHVARAQVAVSLSAYRDAEKYASAQRDLLHQVRSSVKAGTAAEQVLVQQDVDRLLAELRAVLAFGDLHAALAAHDSALGNSSARTIESEHQ